MARAREQDPLGSTEAVEAAGDQLEDRVTESMVDEALTKIHSER
jgi:hypothetical protein